MPTLSNTLITRPDAPPPERWVLFLHGILGTGANWRTFARQWVDAKPGWGAVLVDLRMHGASQGFEQPHTVQAAAQDLVELAPTLEGPVEAVVGHSFGGKVALAYVDRRHGELERAVILDSSPGTRLDKRGSETTLGVLQFLERVGPSSSRNDFIQKAQGAGLSQGIAMWLAMNLEKRGEEMVFKLDLDAIHAMLDDYFRLDLWEVLERPPGRVVFDVVLGGTSRVFSDEERVRIERLAGEQPDRIQLHTLPEAGHWLHVDDPAGVTRILLA
jgi:pimeloyl-ACP methyl ester carboxylesterase